ncbi:MAG: hypothetical protein GYA46_00595 [candidate division Zixibacteria bacterium]|nr:hypothetical protein [candidate division Zixibacteria bacterium]
MVNAAIESTAGPLDLLMGLSMPSGESKVPDGSDPFSVLMGLAPWSVLNGIPVPGLAASGGSAAANGPVVPNGKVLLSLAPEMMALLGINAENLPAQPQGLSADGSSASPAEIPAEISVPEDALDGIITVKIAGGMSLDGNREPVAVGENGEPDVSIPMHLRTVEQVGQTMVATADLLTAAGKETSVRMQWDVSGRLNGNQGMMGTPDQTSGSLLESQTAGGSGVWSRLLNNVGATLMVIENIDAPSSPALPALLPGAAAIPTKPMTVKTAPGAARLSASPLPISAPPTVSIAVAAPIETTAGKTGASVSLPAGDAAIDESVNQVDSPIDCFPPLEKVQTAVGKPSGVDPAALNSSAGLTRTTETSQDGASVRFLDLEAKLEQLKSTGGQKIRIQLVPANLGKMELSIASHRNMVTVTLTLDSNQAREAVQQSLPVLESRLAASGIRVDNFQIIAAPSSKETFVATMPQTMAHDGLGGYRREGQEQRQGQQSPRRRYEAPGDFTFSAAMVNCLA